MGRQPRLIERTSPAARRGLLLLLLPVVLSGCGSAADAPMTKEEKDNFKGGPMPANFMAKPGAEPPKGPPK